MTSDKPKKSILTPGCISESIAYINDLARCFADNVKREEKRREQIKEELLNAFPENLRHDAESAIERVFWGGFGTATVLLKDVDAFVAVAKGWPELFTVMVAPRSYKRWRDVFLIAKPNPHMHKGIDRRGPHF